MDKIYKISNVKKNIKYISSYKAISYFSWLIALFATPGNLRELPFLGLYAGLAAAEEYQKSLVPKTEELKRLKEIYSYVLQEIEKLSKTMEIKTPIGVYTLFNFLYNNNNFTSLSEDVVVRNRLEKYMMGELCLNNHGVCRHISKMLMDLYQQMGYESTIGVCAQIHKKAAMRASTSLTQEDILKMFEEMKQMASKEGKMEFPDIDEVLVMPPIEIYEEDEPLSKRTKKYGNHAITLVNDQDHTYYLDAFNSGIYVTNPEDPTQMIDEEHRKIIMAPKGQKVFNNRLELTPIEIKPQRELDDMYKEACFIGDDIIKNIDLVYDFHEEILEPLEEAEEIVQLILK